LPVVYAGATLSNEFRFVSTNPFVVSSSSCFLDISINMVENTATESIALDNFAVIKYEEINRTFSNPLDDDTDEDGIIDGKEASKDAYWFEAEDFVFDNDYILADCNASNGKLVSTTHLALADPTTIVTVETINQVNPGYYTLFIRGYGLHGTLLDVKITSTSSDGTITISGKYEMNSFFPRGFWTPVYYNSDPNDLTFKLSTISDIQIEILTDEFNTGDSFSIDKILLVKMTFERPEGAGGTMGIGILPRLLTDSLDPDTDGDQYRNEIGADNGEDCETCNSMLGLTGYLTDDFELDSGLNPLSLDSDTDFLADDVDPNPLGTDADDDGIPDYVEDSYPEGAPDGTYQSDSEYSDWCDADTDRDRVLDGTEDWNFNSMLDIGETFPNDPDTDNDGLLDGGASESTWILSGKGHDYTTAVGSEQYYSITGNLNQINDSGTFYNPWITSGNTVTFKGELDVDSDPNDPDTDDDGLDDGVEVFVYGTKPDKADTDGDTLTDYEEVKELGTDPLVPDWPDLLVKSVTVYPDPPDVESSGYSNDGVIIVDVENSGTVEASGKILIKATSNSRTQKLSIESLGVGQQKTVQFYFRYVSNEDYQNNLNGFPNLLVFKPGKYDLDINIETKNPPTGYSKITEIGYSNNEYEQELTIKGADPYCILSTKRCIPMITPGQDINFSFYGNDVDGEIVKYEIDFTNDGIWDYTSTQAGSINHTYTETSYIGNIEADFVAVLRVTDDDNKTATDTKNISVLPSLTDDSDGDGLTNQEEIDLGTNLYDADYDHDNLNDYQEIKVYYTDPFKADTDSDGMRDDREILVSGFFGLNPFYDADEDGLPIILDADSDNDGLKDGTELKFSRPDESESVETQVTKVENWHGTNPYYWDTDYDGIPDANESGLFIRGVYGRPHFGYSPCKADTDQDGLSDFDEIYLYDTEVDNVDTDGDGLEDGLDLQPATGVKQLEFNRYAEVRYSQSGCHWAEKYPYYMLRYEQDIKLWGIDGNTMELWLEDENLGNEGVIDSDISSDVVEEIGLGIGQDITVHTTEEIGERDSWGTFYSLTDGLEKYEISYKLVCQKYHAYLWNERPTRHPNDIWYTAWQVRFDTKHDNSIEMQYKITPQYDRYSTSNEDNPVISGFMYKLYKNGDGGLEINPGDPGYVVNDGDFIYGGIAHGSYIKNHFYRAEIRIPKEEITSQIMWVVISPVWINKNGDMTKLDPHNLGFASLSKLVYYEDEKEVLRMGCNEFNDLTDEYYTDTWRGESYVNFTSVRKLDEDLYESITETKVIKTRKMADRCWDDANIVLEKVVYQSSYRCNGTNFTGEFNTSKYDYVRSTLIDADIGSVLAYDYEEATICFEGIPTIVAEGKFAATSAAGELYPRTIGPGIFRSLPAKTAVKKMGYITAIAFSIPDFVQAGVNYATAENSIAKQQAKEQLIGTGVGLGISLIGVAIGGPYMLIFQVVWKGLIYGFDKLGLIPSNCRVSTLASPEALIAFAITYLAGSPPSELTERALTEANDIASDWVKEHDEEDESDLVHVYIPPKN